MVVPTSSIRYRQHSSWDHVTTQAPPLRQSRDTAASSWLPLLFTLMMHGQANIKIGNYLPV
jgi:hypothetical protein